VNAGFWGFLQDLGDLQTGHAELDHAYIVRAGNDGVPMLLNASPELIAIGEHDAQFTIGKAELEIKIIDIKNDVGTLPTLMSQVLSLWRLVFLYRAGFRTLEKAD